MNNGSKLVQWGMAVLVMLLAIGVTYADEGLYVDAAVGRAKLDNRIDGVFLEDDTNTYRVGAGYDLGNNIALEGGYLFLGDIDANLSNDLAAGHTDGFVANGRFTMPLTDTLDASARVGLFFWDSDVELAGGAFGTEGEDLFYGVGLEFRATRNLTLTAQWDRFEFGDGEADALWAGLRVKF